MTNQERVALAALQKEVKVPVTLGIEGEFITGTTPSGSIYVSDFKIEDVILLLINGTWSHKKLADTIVSNISKIQILRSVSNPPNLTEFLVNMSKVPIDLNDSRMMDTTQAAEEWNIDSSYIRQYKDKFPKGTIRKFGKQFVVTAQGMYAVFGDPRERKILLPRKK